MNIIVNQPEYVNIVLEKEEKLKELRAKLQKEFGSGVFAVKSEVFIENEGELSRNLGDVEIRNAEVLDWVTTALRVTVERILEMILVEYLTLNFYFFLRTDICDELKRNIKSFLAAKELKFSRTLSDEIKNNLTEIAEKTRKDILAKTLDYCHYYRYLVSRDMDELQIDLINKIESEFTMAYNNAIRIKGPLSHNDKIVDNEQLIDESDYLKKRSTGSPDCFLCHLICECSCFSAVTNHCFLCKIFFPSLVYKDHMVHESDNCYGKLMIDGSFYNATFKSFVGYFCAVFFIYVTYFYLRYQHYADALQGTSILAFMSIIFIFGLGFNTKVRALVLLIIPFLSTSQGRAIISYKALDICHHYIYPNFLTNVKNLEVSFVCTRGLMMDQLSRFSQVSSFFRFINQAVRNIQILCEMVRKAITALVRFLKTIIEYVKMVVKIMGLMSSVCSNSYWKPFELCTDLVSSTISTCKENNRTLGWLTCLPLYYGYIWCVGLSIFNITCLGVKNIFGTIFGAFKDAAVNVWDATLGRIFGSFANLFEFKFNATRVYEYQSHVDNSVLKFSVNLKSELNERVNYLSSIYDDINYVFPVALLYIFYCAWSYHRNYLKSNSFDNYVISTRFKEIDRIRESHGKNTLLPLQKGMKYEFIELTDFKQTATERKSTKWGFVFLVIAMLPIIFYVSIDSVMIHVNTLVRKHANVRVEVGSAASYGLSVHGNGFMASLYTFLFKRFESLAKSNITIDTSPCLPAVSRCDLNVYKMLRTYVVLLVFFTANQAYIQRLRTVLMGSVYPDRDRERAIWLYNHIIVFKTHVIFKFKSLLRVKTAVMSDWNPLKYVAHIYNFFVNLVSNICYHIFNFCFVVSCYAIFCAYCFGLCERTNLAEFMYVNEQRFFVVFKFLKNLVKSEKCCMICSEPPNADFKKCTNNLCTGYFCSECFDELDNTCPFCNLMLEYRNTGDESFEEDSSDEDGDGTLINRNFNNNTNDSKDDDVVAEDGDEDEDTIEEEEEDDETDYEYQDEKKENENKIVADNYKETFEEIKKRNALRKKLVSEQIFPKARDNSKNAKKKVLFKMNKRKTKRVIVNKLHDLYKALDGSVAVFELKSKRERSAISDVFLEDYDVYNRISKTVFNSIVENISLNEFFDVNEIYTKSFYESLANINDDVAVFKAKFAESEDTEYDENTENEETAEDEDDDEDTEEEENDDEDENDENDKDET